MTAIALPISYKHASTPTGWNDTWQAAKSAAASSQQNVVILGDSITQGNVASSYRTKSWAGIVSNTLRTRFGNAGEFIGVTESRAAPMSETGFATGEDMWTWAGTWTKYSLIGMLGWSIMSTSNSATATFTAISGLTFTDFDLRIQQEPGGSAFTVTVDGVGATADGGSGTMTCLSAVNYLRHVAIPFSGFSNAAHTIVITGAASAAKTIIGGITVYPQGRGHAGVVVNRVNLAGQTTQLLIPLYPSHLASADAFSNLQAAKASIEDFSPKLVIIALGVNDCGTARGTGLTEYALGQGAQSAQNANASLVFLIPSIVNPGLANYESWGIYRRAIKNVATTYGAAVVDIQAYWASLGNPSTYYYTDNIHPTDLGHASIAAKVLSIL